MGPLLIRTGWQLVVVFAAIAVVVVGIAQFDAARPLLFGIEGVIAVAAVAIVGAALVLQPLLIRIEALDATLAAASDLDAAPLQLPGADPQGDELARLAARLEALAAQAARQRHALADAERRRHDLIANVSHDLRTPLAALQGYLELLLLRQDQLATPEARHYLQTAVAQCERLGRLVGDLFELSRLEGGTTRPQTEPFPLAELAHDVAQKFAPAAQRRDVTLAARCSDGAMVEADLALIARVLDNLVDNALRHTPAGGAVTIEVGTQAGRACMSVSDTGEGIAADRLPGLLDHYERSARTGPAGANGHAGLGLAIAQRIVALHGSRLQIDSRRGEGTCVSFELARARAPHRDLSPDPRI